MHPTNTVCGIGLLSPLIFVFEIPSCKPSYFEWSYFLWLHLLFVFFWFGCFFFDAVVLSDDIFFCAASLSIFTLNYFPSWPLLLTPSPIWLTGFSFLFFLPLFFFFFFLHRVQVGDSLFSQWLLPNSPRPSFRHLKASLGNLPALRRGLHSLSKHSPSLNKRWNIEHTLQGWEFIIYYYFGAKMV